MRDEEKSTPEIGILLGSKSDLALVKKAEDVFSFFGVTWEISVASAHRTPEDVARYASKARGRGIRVLVAAAGLSAALPGVVAAHTTLPVVGIPVNAGSVGGIDALLAVAQMPPGVPVASAGIGSAIRRSACTSPTAVRTPLILMAYCDGFKWKSSRRAISGSSTPLVSDTT